MFFKHVYIGEVGKYCTVCDYSRKTNLNIMMEETKT